MKKLFPLLTVFFIFIILPGCAKKTKYKPADLVLIHGKIITMDENCPQVEAMAVKRDKIMANQGLSNLFKDPRTNWGYIAIVAIVALVAMVGILSYARG